MNQLIRGSEICSDPGVGQQEHRLLTDIRSSAPQPAGSVKQKKMSITKDFC